jgi:ribosomal protein S27AE
MAAYRATPEAKEKQRAAVRARLLDPANVEKKREAQKRYESTFKGKATRARFVEKGGLRGPSLRYRRKYPERYAANTAVTNALADGRLQRQPCEGCGAKRAQAHHDDYAKPLVVRWLCARCHVRHHRGR